MSDPSEISVAILAGGFGTRLISILPDQQKVVARVREHPFLEYILDQLNKNGFKNVVICTGHLGNQVQVILGNNYKSLSLYYVNELSPLGTAGAIRLALPFLASEDILVTNGDSFLDTDLKKFLKFHIGKKANGTIILTEVSDTSRYGRVELDGNNQIISFEEKKQNKGTGFINGGIYLLKKSLLLQIPENKTVSFENDIFPGWIGKGFFGYKGSNNFIDIGTPENYAQAEQFLAKYQL